MKKFKYNLISLILILLFSILIQPNTVWAKEENQIDLAKNSFSCILANESGEIIYGKNKLDKRPIASMTKFMTLLVIYDNINNKKINLDDDVTISKNASSMGGSQAFLDANSTHKVKDLIKIDNQERENGE